jgi:hypothetical protein
MLLLAVGTGRWAAAEPPTGFASLLRRLRQEAGLTHEELAEAASLGLIGPARAGFEAAARGRAGPGGAGRGGGGD